MTSSIDQCLFSLKAYIYFSSSSTQVALFFQLTNILWCVNVKKTSFANICKILSLLRWRFFKLLDKFWLPMDVWGVNIVFSRSIKRKILELILIKHEKKLFILSRRNSWSQIHVNNRSRERERKKKRMNIDE
jgi:hypothetical protein